MVRVTNRPTRTLELYHPTTPTPPLLPPPLTRTRYQTRHYTLHTYIENSEKFLHRRYCFSFTESLNHRTIIVRKLDRYFFFFFHELAYTDRLFNYTNNYNTILCAQFQQLITVSISRTEVITLPRNLESIFNNSATVQHKDRTFFCTIFFTIHVPRRRYTPRQNDYYFGRQRRVYRTPPGFFFAYIPTVSISTQRIS